MISNMATKRRLQTLDRLVEGGIQIDSTCEEVTETHQHHFFVCPSDNVSAYIAAEVIRVDNI